MNNEPMGAVGLHPEPADRSPEDPAAGGDPPVEPAAPTAVQLDEGRRRRRMSETDQVDVAERLDRQDTAIAELRGTVKRLQGQVARMVAAERGVALAHRRSDAYQPIAAWWTRCAGRATEGMPKPEDLAVSTGPLRSIIDPAGQERRRGRHSPSPQPLLFVYLDKDLRRRLERFCRRHQVSLRRWPAKRSAAHLDAQDGR